MLTIYPYHYQGTVDLPRSKSYLQRALAIAALMPGTTTLKGFTLSNDVKAALDVISQFGASYEVVDNEVFIQGVDLEKITISELEINCGEAGLSTRMFTPIASLLSDQVSIKGEGSILNRSMEMVSEALTQLGAKVESNAGKLPLEVSNRIKGGVINIDGSSTSQLLTGLLIALSFSKESSVIHVKDLKSRPYIQMTLDILAHFGRQIRHQDFKSFEITPQKLTVGQKMAYEVEGDWSGAAFHIVGAAISGSIRLKGLNPDSSQADQAILEVLDQVGTTYFFDQNKILHIEKNALNSFHFDATDCPDLFPPLAALAVACPGVCRIKGLHRLADKESDRALVIKVELEKLGVHVVFQEDEMHITGKSIEGGRLNAHNDHRIAMMAGTLAAIAKTAISIEDEWAINKSYPQYYEDLKSIGAQVS